MGVGMVEGKKVYTCISALEELADHPTSPHPLRLGPTLLHCFWKASINCFIVCDGEHGPVDFDLVQFRVHPGMLQDNGQTPGWS